MGQRYADVWMRMHARMRERKKSEKADKEDAPVELVKQVKLPPGSGVGEAAARKAAKAAKAARRAAAAAAAARAAAAPGDAAEA